MKLVVQQGVTAFVHFAGTVPRNKLIDYVKDCDIYVSTSLTDGTSSGLIEAMFCGIPPIVTRIAGNEEWVTDGLNGLLFEPLKFQQLANLIIRVASNPNERVRISSKTAERLKNKVKWPSAFNELTSRMIAAKSKYFRQN
jgi:glycosyltransferase involved in cell wall biosynthesis